ncbi:alkene reductase [Halioglobus maricola]|uniref:Alkene reductase n=1 Tax=Halioglobus maricola TaxID=2601894 RepID=A0A5P9NPS4_9GAMM|nr:alkene reductase [Halioglobus maricola]
MFEPLQLGDLQLRNRVVMAPMTRSRAAADGMPTDTMVEYYRQRASAGMIITEGVAPSADGLGYCRTPGIYNPAQAAAWRRVTDAVHGEGGLIVAQLMHVGRVASALNKPAGSATVAPSAITARGEIYTDQQGMQPLDSPRALSLSEIAEVVVDYRYATELAYEAGFDGVELHCTSGYLPAQFFSSGTNTRQDNYGGSAENRCRFALDVLREISGVDGAGRVGMRICPDNPFNDLQDDDPQETFDTLLSKAAEFGLAYLHTIRLPTGRVDNLALGRKYFAANMIGNESYSAVEAAAAIAAGAVEAVSFGRDFIANPDLPRRIREGRDLARMDFATLYTPGEEGYTSYPPLN